MIQKHFFLDYVNSRKGAGAKAPAKAPRPTSVNTSSPYIEMATRIANEEGVDPLLVLSVIQQESSFNPKSHSKAGAIGLMQLMPGTARDLGVTNPWDPEQNIRGGVRYLKQQLNAFKDPSLALAAYNAGPGNVRKYGGVPPFSETQNYVKSVNAHYSRYKSHRQQGMAPTSVKVNPPNPVTGKPNQSPLLSKPFQGTAQEVSVGMPNTVAPNQPGQDASNTISPNYSLDIGPGDIAGSQSSYASSNSQVDQITQEIAAIRDELDRRKIARDNLRTQFRDKLVSPREQQPLPDRNAGQTPKNTALTAGAAALLSLFGVKPKAIMNGIQGYQQSLATKAQSEYDSKVADYNAREGQNQADLNALQFDLAGAEQDVQNSSSMLSDAYESRDKVQAAANSSRQKLVTQLYQKLYSPSATSDERRSALSQLESLGEQISDDTAHLGDTNGMSVNRYLADNAIKISQLAIDKAKLEFQKEEAAKLHEQWQRDFDQRMLDNKNQLQVQWARLEESKRQFNIGNINEQQKIAISRDAKNNVNKTVESMEKDLMEMQTKLAGIDPAIKYWQDIYAKEDAAGRGMFGVGKKAKEQVSELGALKSSLIAQSRSLADSILRAKSEFGATGQAQETLNP